MHPKDPRNSLPPTTRQQSFSWFHGWLLHSFIGFKSIFNTRSFHPGLTGRVVVVSIVSIRAFQTIYLAKCEFARAWWQIHWKESAGKTGLQRLHLSKEELSPGPGFGDAFDLPEPSSRPYCWFSSLSKYCQINYQGRGQCSTESFSFLQLPGRKGFLKLSQITRKQAWATEKYPNQWQIHNIQRAKILVSIRYFWEWRIACYGGVGINPEQHLIMTLSHFRGTGSLGKTKFQRLVNFDFDFSFGQKMSIVVNIGSDIKICVDFGLKGLLDFTARG